MLVTAPKRLAGAHRISGDKPRRYWAFRFTW